MKPSDMVTRLRDLAGRIEQMALSDDMNLHCELACYHDIESLDVLRRVASVLTNPEPAEYDNGHCLIREGKIASDWKVVFHYKRGLLGEKPVRPIISDRPARLAALMSADTIKENVGE